MGVYLTYNPFLSHLNQIHKCRICTVNRRLYKLGKIKLYHSIYVNTSYRYQIQNSPIIYTNFNIKFTIVNIQDSLEWLHRNSNINFIKNMVFGEDRPMFYCVRSLYPWIDATIEHLSDKYKTYHTPQNFHSILSKGYAIPVLHKSQKLPWVNKLTVYVEHVKYLDLLKIASFFRLKNLKTKVSLSKKSSKFLLSKIKEIFNLKILTTFQLHLYFKSAHPDHIETEVMVLLSKLPNLKHLSLISQNIGFNRVIKVLKPNSLHSLYLKIVQVKDIIETNEI
ncbi:hypothetical protein JA1_003500 [Spathaspora sp. JA1]|nr:hypothetical protein JA1_003500 [Spathaspora sp. JA1]